ncbi:uncharacterized protein RAG0_03524 [Rhynchosporium agropyri]|uniref:Uncharacterized protein n=1 Tax=Rhynchosporium agropyri TaxID=914238 RepID=A0A1E1K4L8_9HELO|nr:uncharacterized protein RAG0_03524 [Rhynchosporium agropyri]
MSYDETERFLKEWSATVPVPEDPAKGTFISYGELQKSVESYIKLLRDENDNLPLDCRLPENTLIYQAKQTTVFEWWGFPGHNAFPPPLDPVAHESLLQRRLEHWIATQPNAPGNLAYLEISFRNPAAKLVLQSTEPVATLPQVQFRAPPSSRKRKSYRKRDNDLQDSDEDDFPSQAPPSTIQGPQEPEPFKSTQEISRKSRPRISITYDGSMDGDLSREKKDNSSKAVMDALDTGSRRGSASKPSSTVVGAVVHKEPIPPIWPGLKIQGSWDPRTGFPTGAFIFSTDRAFPRIVGQIVVNGVGQVLGKVNERFPLLNFRWKRTEKKNNGRRDLAVWVEIAAAGKSRTDPQTLDERELAVRGLCEFHRRDLAGSDEYLDLFFGRTFNCDGSGDTLPVSTSRDPALPSD